MKPHLLLLFAPFLAGCAITDYPVIFDSRGAGEEMVVDTGYQAAYIQPSVQAATVWDDGTDQVITLVSQDWTGDVGAHRKTDIFERSPGSASSPPKAGHLK